jgi:hypothetical protein
MVVVDAMMIQFPLGLFSPRSVMTVQEKDRKAVLHHHDHDHYYHYYYHQLLSDHFPIQIPTMTE